MTDDIKRDLGGMVVVLTDEDVSTLRLAISVAARETATRIDELVWFGGAGEGDGLLDAWEAHLDRLDNLHRVLTDSDDIDFTQIGDEGSGDDG